MLNMLENTRELSYTVEELTAKDWVEWIQDILTSCCKTNSPYKRLKTDQGDLRSRKLHAVDPA